MKGWHCQGRRAAVKVCAESYKAPEGEAPSRSWVQGHPYEGGATGAGNGMKACLLRRMALEGKTRQASTSADATAKKQGKTKLFSEMREMHRKAERKGDEATWAGAGQGLECY